jgi:hypothetical protein
MVIVFFDFLTLFACTSSTSISLGFRFGIVAVVWKV